MKNGIGINKKNFVILCEEKREDRNKGKCEEKAEEYRSAKAVMDRETN